MKRGFCFFSVIFLAGCVSTPEKISGPERDRAKTVKLLSIEQKDSLSACDKLGEIFVVKGKEDEFPPGAIALRKFPKTDTLSFNGTRNIGVPGFGTAVADAYMAYRCWGK